MTRGWMGARSEFDAGDEDVPEYLRNLSWKCDICHRERPDAQISVYKVDIDRRRH